MTCYITLPERAIDITGQRFSRLVALGPVEHTVNKSVRWLCQCDCGDTNIVPAKSLRFGDIQSCGCLSRDKSRQRRTTHGKSATSIYRIWRLMITRCENPHHKAYHHYGGRGIGVCPEWRASFEDFEFYVAQLPRYSEPGYKLDRIDNDDGYKPGNVKWSTQAQQLRNTRRTRWITIGGKMQCAKDWCDELGVNKSTFYQRLELGWSVESALTTPVQGRAKL